MKRTTKLFSLLLITVLICGCKQDNWLDWKLQNELWLINNAKQADVKTTYTGLQYKCIEKGWEGSTRPDNAKTVTITYTGKFINGHLFESTYNNEQGKDIPATMSVSGLVSGFAEGLKMMNQFGIYEFYIPYYLGYGEVARGTEGASFFIPPYTTLIFRVELHRIN